MSKFSKLLRSKAVRKVVPFVVPQAAILFKLQDGLATFTDSPKRRTDPAEAVRIAAQRHGVTEEQMLEYLAQKTPDIGQTSVTEIKEKLKR